ncbi:putative transposase [Labrenzia sp. EL_126]|nr:putative transposase [Labrenzia sp. EL_126]
MKRKRFTEEQIISVLKESEAGANTDDICRRQGISSATFYSWRKKYGGMDVSDANRGPVTKQTLVRVEKIDAFSA